MSIYDGAQLGVDDLQREIRAQIEPVQIELAKAQEQINSLTTAVNIASANNYAPIVNILDNSHPEWSKDAYLHLGVDPTTVSDDNTECYNWHRLRRSEITTFSKSAANALKSPGHSLYAANEGANENIPRWDRVNGQIEIGGNTENWDLLYQLPTNIVNPGMVFYVQFEAMLRTGNAIPANLQIFADFFDTTPGQEKTLEGGTFEIDGEIFGSQAGATNVKYQVVARSDSGEEAISNVLEFTNAPVAFTQNNHPRINLNGAPGFIAFDIYRLKGGVYEYIFQVKNSIDTTFFDVGNPAIRTVAAFPSLTATTPKARAQTRVFAPGSLSNSAFVRNTLTIFVPTTYNKSLTAPGSQWFRIGVLDLCDEARQIVLRRLGLSQGEAQWARSANDQLEGAHSTPSAAPVSAPAGNAGGGVQEPPPFGSGGFDCILLDTKFNVCSRNGFSKIPLSELENDAFIDSAGAICGKVIKVRRGQASRIFRIETANGLKIGCTAEHPFITTRTDIFGTSAQRLKKRFDKDEEPVTVLTKIGEAIEESRIVSMKEEFGQFEVGITVQEGSHIMVANGFLCHNIKDDRFNYYSTL